MARDFDGSGDKLTYGGAVVSGVPFTMSCRFNPRNVTADHWLMTVCTDASGNQYHALVANGAVAGDELNAWSRTTSSANAGTAPAAFVANQWQHACGVWAANNDRRVYLDNQKGTDSGNRAPSGMNTTRLGADPNSANVLDGLLAEACIWNVALTDAEVAMLAAGVHPRMIRPASIVAYWPTWGTMSPEPDVSGNARHLTVTNTTRADHPPRIFAFQKPRRVQRKATGTIHSAAASLVVTATVAAKALGVLPAAAALTASASVAALPRVAHAAAASLTGSCCFYGTGTIEDIAQAALAASATVQAAPRATLRVAAALTATGTVAADAQPMGGALLASAALSASGTLAGTPRMTQPVAAALAASGTVAAEPRLTQRVASALAASGVLAGSVRLEQRIAAALAASGTLTGDAQIGGTHLAAADLLATATVAAVPRLAQRIAASMLAEATVAADARTGTTHLAAADLLASASVAGSARLVQQIAASMLGTATVQASATQEGMLLAAAALTAGAVVGANARMVYAAAAALTGSATVAPDATLLARLPHGSIEHDHPYRRNVIRSLRRWVGFDLDKEDEE